MSGLSTLSLHIMMPGMMPGRPTRLSGSSMTYDIAAAQSGTDMNASDRLATALHDLLSGLAGFTRSALARAGLAMIARGSVSAQSVSAHSISVHADAAHSIMASLISAPISVAFSAPFSVAFSGLIPALKMVLRFKNPPVNCAVQSVVQPVVNWHASVLS